MTPPPTDIAWRAGQVLYRYCRAIDAHDANALRDVFADDVVLVVGGGPAGAASSGQRSFSGRETVVALLSSLFEQRRWARHLVSNVVADVVDGGDIAVDSYFQFVLDKDGASTIGVGDYHATMREVDGRLVITVFAAAIVDEITVPR